MVWSVYHFWKSPSLQPITRDVALKMVGVSNSYMYRHGRERLSSCKRLRWLIPGCSLASGLPAHLDRRENVTASGWCEPCSGHTRKEVPGTVR